MRKELRARRSVDRRDKKTKPRDITVKHRYFPPSKEPGDHSIGLLADTAVELAYKILAREGIAIAPDPTAGESREKRLPGYTVSGEPEP